MTDSKPKKSRGKPEVHYEVIMGLLKTLEAKEGLKGHVGEWWIDRDEEEREGENRWETGWKMGFALI